MKLELLDQRVPQVLLVQLEHLAQWDLLECQGREDALDPVEYLVCEVLLATLANQAQWVLWESMDQRGIQEALE